TRTARCTSPSPTISWVIRASSTIRRRPTVAQAPPPWWIWAPSSARILERVHRLPCESLVLDRREGVGRRFDAHRADFELGRVGLWVVARARQRVDRDVAERERAEHRSARRLQRRLHFHEDFAAAAREHGEAAVLEAPRDDV